MIENYVRLTVVFPVAHLDQKECWAAIMKSRMAGVLYPVPIVIEKVEGFIIED